MQVAQLALPPWPDLLMICVSMLRGLLRQLAIGHQIARLPGRIQLQRAQSNLPNITAECRVRSDVDETS